MSNNWKQFFFFIIYIITVFSLWALALLEDKYTFTLVALSVIVFSYFLDWAQWRVLYKSTCEKIEILNYLSGKSYIFAIIFLMISCIIQSQPETVPVFDNVNWFLYINFTWTAWTFDFSPFFFVLIMRIE